MKQARLLTGAVLAILLLASRSAGAEGPWEGYWEAYSVGEDAYLSLRQDGDQVVGTYFPYNGQLEGTAEDGVLRGTWHSPNGDGSFLFALTADGKYFSGSIGSGEWWNGRRIEEDDIGVLAIDLRDPGRTVRSFLSAGRAFRKGEISGLQAMFSTLHFSGDPGFAERSRRARLLYDVLAQTTFRVFEVRPASGGAALAAAPLFRHRFEQAGTDESVTLTFRRDLFELWRIEAPEAQELELLLERMLKARGIRQVNPSRHLELASPRDAVEAFVEGMERWDDGGAELVRRTLDFSAVSEKLREWRLPVVATFLAGNLNRIGRLTLQEVPDDPQREHPFRFYQHAVGDIVLAPTVDADGRTRWQFDVGTVASAKKLHDALRTVPVVFDNVRNPRVDNPYFRARALAYALSPTLTEVVRGVELWQWLGLLLFAAVLPVALHLLMRRIEAGLGVVTELSAGTIRVRYTLVLRLLVVGGIWILASTTLGLSDRISGPLYAAGWLLVIVGVTWQLYRAVDAATRGLHGLARQTETTADDVAVTLASGLAKILLVVGAAVAVADVFGLPYQTVVAGIGVSGLALAIASRDLLANLFGSAIIASDRPFTRGDFISVGDIMGTVEKVGLRSTRLRPVDDTSVTIPNSSITTDRVVNLSQRRKIRVLETIHVSHDASVDAIRALRERIRGELLADPMVSEENVRVGLATVSLYAVDMELSFYVKTTNYDEFLYEKHRLMAQVLSTLEAAGVQRAVIRRD
ncbi:MAG: mechanosensitive ion channel family protein [Pseudomonadales bacterium]|jgi:small-conductance mechanosensitive channel|nr:mechanosensitive ion channel family protein [Pseudomonadales bacterium]